tara:strand:+ start:307 stop:1518 length:1212 start_codon:yes stop_codon:yes gene_type:complete
MSPQVEMSLVKNLPTISQIKDMVRAKGYNVPGVDSGADQYRRMLDFAQTIDAPLYVEEAKNLNIQRHGEVINLLQNRKTISTERIEDIRAKWEERNNRILWCGWAWETTDDNGNIVHYIISGYHRDAFCREEKIPFHFIVVSCDELDAIELAGLSNAEDTAQVAHLDEAGKEKHGESLAKGFIKSKGWVKPLSKSQIKILKADLHIRMLRTFEEYKNSERAPRLTKMVRTVADRFSSTEDKTALTLKFEDKAQQYEYCVAQWNDCYGEGFDKGNLMYDNEDSDDRQIEGIQLYSDSQLVNYERRLFCSMSMDKKYDEIYDNPGAVDVHLMIALDADKATMRKSTIESKIKKWIDTLTNWNTNRRSRNRMGIPVHRRVYFAPVFEGQEGQWYEWTSSKKFELQD